MCPIHAMLKGHSLCPLTISFPVSFDLCCRFEVQRVPSACFDSFHREKLQYCWNNILQSAPRCELAVCMCPPLCICIRMANRTRANLYIWMPDGVQHFHRWRGIWPSFAAVADPHTELHTNHSSLERTCNLICGLKVDPPALELDHIVFRVLLGSVWKFDGYLRGTVRLHQMLQV